MAKRLILALLAILVVISIGLIGHERDWQEVLIPIFSVLAVIVLIVSAVVLWNKSLRRQVLRRTEKLQKEKELSNVLLQTCPAFFGAISVEGKTMMMNEAMLSALGYTAEEIKDKDYLTTFVPEREHGMLSEIFEKLTKSHTPTLNENHILTKDGRELLVEWHGRPVFKNTGELDFFYGVGIEITDRKRVENALRESERKLSTLMGNLPGMAYRCMNDRDWTMEFISDGGLDLTGYAPDSLIGNRGLSYNDLIHPEDRGDVWNKVQEAVSQKRPFQLQYRIRTKSGSEKWVWEQGVGIFSGKGELLALEGLIVDITEQKRAEQELSKYRDHLEELVTDRTGQLEQKASELEAANLLLQEADRLKSVFLASMSHELRTPLNSIIGFTGIILLGMVGEISDEQKTQLTMVKKSAEHLLSLINDLLDIARIEAGRVEPSFEEFVLDDVIKEVMEGFSHAVMEKGLELTKDISEGIKLVSDKRRIKQILINLVGNAVKFTDRGRVEIAAGILGGEKLEMIVRDTGIGMKEEDMDRLFQLFQQLDMSLTKPHEGTGLGLYLTRKLADLLGGTVTAKSTIGKGSEFTFTVPLKAKEV